MLKLHPACTLSVPNPQPYYNLGDECPLWRAITFLLFFDKF